MSPLEKSILSTLIYFDIFDYPLTFIEVCRYLYKSKVKSQKSKVKDGLTALKDKINTNQGFYFLKGRETIVQTRLKRYNIAERKYKRALRIVKILRLLPFVRMIAVCNNLAYSNARDESDVDLFIITKTGRIWCCRFFVLMVLKFLGLRPKGKNTRDKICASFFVTENNLNLEEIKINEDIYLSYWLEQIVPIYDENGIYEKFRKANRWSQKFVDGYDVEMIGRRMLSDCSIARLLKCFCEKLFLDIDEKFYRWLQTKIMPKKLKELANKNTNVVINNQMLKFHDNDKRVFYREIFNKKLHECLYE